MTWIPVTERLPKDYVAVLIIIEHHDRAYCAWGSSKYKEWHQDDGFCECEATSCASKIIGNVTHWMDLPEGPKQ